MYDIWNITNIKNKELNIAYPHQILIILIIIIIIIVGAKGVSIAFM